MDYDGQIYLLSSQFRRDYPATQYSELIEKLGRPFACLLVSTHYDYFIGIPFRSNIKHKNAYKFKSANSMRQSPGLDYSKIVILKKLSYLDTPATVDRNEYNEIMQNLNKIVTLAVNYIEVYIKHMKGISKIHPQEFLRNYRFSTLKYFHIELGIF